MTPSYSTAWMWLTYSSFPQLISPDDKVSSSEAPWTQCAQGTRTWRLDHKLLLQVPIWWCRHYQSPEELQKWADQINLVGGNVEFLGVKPYYSGAGLREITLDVLKNKFFTSLMARERLDNDPKTADFAHFVIPADTGLWQRYFTYCLIRYIGNYQYQRIVDFYYDMREKLPDADPAQVLQLAHYTFNPAEETAKGSAGYYARYSAIYDAQWRLLNTKQDNLNALKKATTGLHNALLEERPRYTGTVNVREVILAGDYKKAFDELKG